MHQIALDRAGPNDGDFDHHVVKAFRLHPRQRGHLRAAFDLEHADRVGAAASARTSRDRPAGVARGRPDGRAARSVRSQSCRTDIMPRPSRSTLMMPRSSQSSLSHCATTRPGIEAFSSGTIESECALADDHPAGVLPEMARQAVHLLVELRRTLQRADVRGRPACSICARADPACAENRHWRRDCENRSMTSFGQVERLANFARRAASAIADDVRGHGRAVFAIAAINFLDDALAPVAARQIDIDVGPALAAFAQEAFEEKFDFDRVARGDAEAITDRAIRGAAPALGHNIVLAAELHEVRDNEEVAAEPELLDEREFVFELLFDGVAEVLSVAAARAGEGLGTQDGFGVSPGSTDTSEIRSRALPVRTRGDRPDVMCFQALAASPKRVRASQRAFLRNAHCFATEVFRRHPDGCDSVNR